MRLIIRTLVILGGVFFLQTILPNFIQVHSALVLLTSCIFAAVVPELEKKV